ncbi:MAG TPA: ABC transporter ATP-binding protein [Stellaceae bacterium]|nr:ABC transporter ATP-binding protein [Stellaceae bacterium]
MIAEPSRSAGTDALRVDNLVAGFGDITILHDVSLAVPAGKVTVLLGANGAGKTTLFRAITGLVTPRSGRVSLFGEPIAGKAPHLIARAGIGHVPSGRELFPRMPVSAHLDLGERLCPPEQRAALRRRVLELFPALAERLNQAAGTLSGGEQQMVAIARALMTNPRLLLLDEPSAGLAPKVVLSVFDALGKLQDQGMSVLLAEQSMAFGLSVASRAYIMREGRIVLSGTPAELSAERSVVQAYLGA